MKHRISKWERRRTQGYPFRTRVTSSGQSGTLSLGADTARIEVERRLNRRLAPGTKVRTAGGAWVFIEPVRVPSPSREARKAKRTADPKVTERRAVAETARRLDTEAAAALERKRAAKRERDARYRAAKRAAGQPTTSTATETPTAE